MKGRPFSRVAAVFLEHAMNVAAKTGATFDLSKAAAEIGNALAGLQRFNPRRNAQRKLVDQVGARRYKRAVKALKREALVG